MTATAPTHDSEDPRLGAENALHRRLLARVVQAADVQDSDATAITISRGTVRKMHQNLWWAAGYNSLTLPVAAGVFEPLGFVLRPEVGAISMAGSSIIVALNAVALKRLRLADRAQREQSPPAAGEPGGGEHIPAAQPA